MNMVANIKQGQSQTIVSIHCNCVGSVVLQSNGSLVLQLRRERLEVLFLIITK